MNNTKEKTKSSEAEDEPSVTAEVAIALKVLDYLLSLFGFEGLIEFINWITVLIQ